MCLTEFDYIYSYQNMKNINIIQILRWTVEASQKLKDIIGKKEIKPFIEYAEEKYGKDFVRLYEHGPAV